MTAELNETYRQATGLEPIPAQCLQCKRRFVGGDAIRSPGLTQCRCFFCGGKLKQIEGPTTPRPPVREITNLSDEEWQIICRRAIDYQYLVVKRGGMATKTFTESWLMRRFNITQDAARAVTNHVGEMPRCFTTGRDGAFWLVSVAGRPEPEAEDYPDLPSEDALVEAWVHQVNDLARRCDEQLAYECPGTGMWHDHKPGKELRKLTEAYIYVAQHGPPGDESSPPAQPQQLSLF